MPSNMKIKMLKSKLLIAEWFKMTFCSFKKSGSTMSLDISFDPDHMVRKESGSHRWVCQAQFTCCTISHQFVLWKPQKSVFPNLTLSPRIPKKMGASLVTLEKVLSWRKCHFGAFKGRNGKEYMFSHAHDINIVSITYGRSGNNKSRFL